MSSRFHTRALAFLLGVLAALPAMAAEPFRICAEPDAYPLSRQSDRSGFEIEVAQLLADEIGRPLDIVWIPQRDYAYFRQTLGTGACDAIMSVPAGFNRLTMTKPWYRTGFVFIAREGGVAPRDFNDERLRTLSIGVPVTGLGDGTPPAIALARRALVPNLRPFSVYEPKAMVTAVAEGEVDTAVVWGPFAGWFAGEERVPLSLIRLPARDGPTPFAFDIAIGLKKGNEALRAELDAALERRRLEIEAILARWRVPHGADW